MLPALTPLGVEELDPLPLLPGLKLLPGRCCCEPRADRRREAGRDAAARGGGAGARRPAALHHHAGRQGALPGPPGGRDRRARRACSFRGYRDRGARPSSASRATPTWTSRRTTPATCCEAMQEAVVARRRRAGRAADDLRRARPAAQVLARATQLKVAEQDVYEVDGMLDADGPDAGRQRGRASRSSSTPTGRRSRPRDLLGADDLWQALQEQRRAALPPVRVVRPGGPAARAGGRRPQRAGHQADALPHQRRLADRRARWPGPPRTASR